MRKIIKSKKVKVLFATSAVAIASVAPTVEQLIPSLENVAHAAGEFAGGTGTKADPYLISSPKQLDQIRNFTTSHFKLTTDIDLTDINWIPIPNIEGTIDGDGFKIKNLYINTSNNSVGLIGLINKNGIVKNLTFENPYVKNSGQYSGVVAGQSNGVLNNVHVLNGEVIGGNYFTGGLIGSTYAYGATIEKLSYKGKVNGTMYVGGLFGQARYANINQASSSAEIVSTMDFAGGLIGHTDKIVLNDAYSTGQIDSEGRQTGGIVGELTSSSSINNIYSSMNINGTTDIGGIVGTNAGTINNVFSLNSNIKGSNSNGGHIAGKNTGKITGAAFPDSLKYISNVPHTSRLLNSSELTKAETYQTFDFENVWKINPNGLPTLKSSNVESQLPELNDEPNAEIHEGEISYIIRNPLELNSIRFAPESNFHLKNDIDLDGLNWEPISSFQGKFDGNNFTIKNLYINRNTSSAGLFSLLDKIAVVKNLTFKDPHVEHHYYYTGVLAGEGKGTISNIHVIDGQVSSDWQYTGGLLGSAHSATIQKSSFTGTVEGSLHTGGLVGIIYNSNLDQLFVSAEITNTGGNAGGIIGETQSSSTVTNVHSEGSITSNQKGVGGNIGVVGAGTILNKAYSTMNLKGTSVLGGIVGRNAGQIDNVYSINSKITNYDAVSYGRGYIYGESTGTVGQTFVADSIKSNAHTKGVINLLTKDSLMLQKTFETFDFNEVWKMSDDGLPVLQFSKHTSLLPELAESKRLEMVENNASIIIQSTDELDKIRTATDTDYHLKQNIDMKDIEFAPIPDFSGTLNGNGYVIKNLYINSTEVNTGFFKLLVNGTIKNITFDNPFVKSTKSYTGVIQGGGGRGILSNVHVKNGTILGQSYTGGLAGATQGSIDGSSVQGVVNGTDNVGGLAGYGSYLSIRKSFVAADILASDQLVGGIIGSAETQVSDITDVFTTGTLNAKHYGGGIAGRLNTNLKNAYSTMKVEGLENMSGIVAQNNGRVENVFALNEDIAQTGQVGMSGYITARNNGTINNGQAIRLVNSNLNETNVSKFLTTEQALKKSTYSGFEFGMLSGTPIWAMNEGKNTLPYLLGLPPVISTLPGIEPTINQPPTAKEISDITMDINDEPILLELSSYFTDSDGDPLTFTVESNNENVAALISNKELTINPKNAGESSITVTATDTSGASVNVSFIVTINTVREEKPVVTKPFPDLSFGEDNEKEYDLGEYFNDAEGLFTYSVTSTDPNVATADISDKGVLKITKKSPGTTTITVTAQNSIGEQVVTSFTVTVQEAETPDEPVNIPPVAIQIPNQTSYKGTVKTVDLSTYFSDPNGDSLSYSVSSANELVGTASVNGSTLSLTPKALGSTTITVTANDGKEGTVAQTFTFSVINATPVITLTNENAKQTITNENKVLIKGTVADADRDTLTVKATLAGIEKSVQVEGNGNFILEWDGNTLPSGKYTNIPVTVTDTNQSSSSAIYSGSIEKEATKAPVFLISDLTSNSVKLSWKSVSPNAVYTLYRDGEEIFQGTDLSVTDNDLMANAEYSYSVKATIAGEITPESSVGVVTLANKPAELGVTEQNFDSFVTEWDTNNNPSHTKYRFIVKDGKSVKVDTVINSSNWTQTFSPFSFRMAAAAKLNYSVTGLEPGKTYTVETRAINKLGMETESVVKEVALEDFIVDELENLRISESSNEKVVVEWDHEQDGVEFIVEKYRGYVKVSSEIVKDNSYIDTDIEAGKAYTYKVMPKSEKYDRKASMQSVSTDIPLPEALGAVQNLQVTKTGETEHKIEWNSLAGATRYYIEVYEGNSRKVFLSTTDTFLNTDKLEAGKTYKVSVYAMDAYGRASEKTVIEHEVEKPQPKNITNVTYTIDGKNLTLNWDDISDDVFSYYVQTWQGGKQTANKYVSPKTPTYTASFNKNGEYELRIIAYSKESKGFLEPVIVNVTVTNGNLSVEVEQ